MRRNFLIRLAWDGTDFSGWQRGPAGTRSVQGELEAALSGLLGEAIEVTGASRTDAGVHAEGQAVSFHSRTALEPARIVEGLNGLLPPDLSCLGCREVDPRFHARYRAKGKVYRYRLHVAARPDPQVHRQSLHVGPGLDLGAMREAARAFEGSHDFSAFANDRKADAKPGRVESVGIVESGAFVDILVCGESFRYNQVRIMAAAILEVGRGRLSKEAILSALKTGRREGLPGALGPFGLSLLEVLY